MNVLRAAVRAMEAGERCALVSIIEVQGSTPRHGCPRMLVFEDGRIVGTVGGGRFEYEVIQIAIEAIGMGSSRRFSAHLTRDLGMCCGGTMEAFIEPLASAEDLVIYGSGHVGRAIARMACILGFRVQIIDDRAGQLEFLEEQPGLTKTEADPLRILDTLPFHPGAYHLIVTHSHQLDQDLLERLVARDLAWLGMIGSRTKLSKFFLRLQASGVDPAHFKRVSSPVGLDIGAETPEEIACSIAAELVRVRRASTSPPLPLSERPLTARGGDGKALAPRLSALEPQEP
jgi:xanthine dehydrogenase accessory factor